MKLKTIYLIVWTSWIAFAAMIATGVGLFFGSVGAGVIAFVILALAPLGGSANGSSGKSCSGGDECEYFQDDDHG
ncbi:MAG: hypothetical protein IPM06_18665 [Rhizobiales bacterium]|nr:hypothetical protein [Hyphomicrobiales bacterium]